MLMFVEWTGQSQWHASNTPKLLTLPLKRVWSIQITEIQAYQYDSTSLV